MFSAGSISHANAGNIERKGSPLILARCDTSALRLGRRGTEPFHIVSVKFVDLRVQLIGPSMHTHKSS